MERFVGIDLKIEGGKNAGLDTILLPKENEQDFNIIIKSKPELKEDLNIVFVNDVGKLYHIYLKRMILTL